MNPEQGFDPTHETGIHGGDFLGVTEKLDYLKALGVEAIWISPIHQNVGVASYHGYGAHDFYSLAPHWGSMQDLKDMVDQAHARGIYVILDVVCNHQSRRIDSTDAGWPAYKAPPDGYNLRWKTGVEYPAPFDDLSWFHAHGNIGDYSGTEQELGDLNGLDDLRTETGYVRANLVSIFKYWVSVADFDGFRLDTVRHAEMGFWQSFNPALRTYAASRGKTNFFQFGEVFTGSESKVGSYTGTKAGGAFANDAVLDYPLYFAADDVFAGGTGNTKKLEDHYNAIPGNYDPASAFVLPTFLDNHDNDRFLSPSNADDDWDKLTVALSFLYSSRGIPVLYYGTEQGFNGLESHHGNREDMLDGAFEQGPSRGDNFNMTHPLFLYVAGLNNLRRNYPSLRRGTHANRRSDSDSAGLFAYARQLCGEEVFVVLNTATSTEVLPPLKTDYPEGTVLVNLLDTNELLTVTAGATGLPSVSVSGRQAKMFVSKDLFKPLDPVVVSQSPSHGATDRSVTASIDLQFSRSMNTTTIQSAFSMYPPVAGSFTWTSNDTALEFKPDMPGFSGHTAYRVRIGTNARDAVYGKSLYAAFETFFVTGDADASDVKRISGRLHE